MNSDIWSGGCQCGALRYSVPERPSNACLCHCRMCQKQFGSFFGAFALVNIDLFRITRGEPAWFQSSSQAMRGFCRDCGTPLFYKYLSSRQLAVTIGSLDRHSEVKPLAQFGLEGREPWFADLPHLPGLATGEGDNGYGDTPERIESIRQSSRQHPDHDTADWPAP